MPASNPSPPQDASATVRGLVSLVAQTFAGVKTFLSAAIFSAGVQLGLVFNTNGGSSSDVVVKVGTSVADASANGKLLSARTGLNGGSEVEYFSVRRPVSYGEQVVVIDQRGITNTYGLAILNTPAGIGGIVVTNAGGGKFELNCQQNGSPSRFYSENKGLLFSQNNNAYDTTMLVRFECTTPAAVAASIPAFDFDITGALAAGQDIARFRSTTGQAKITGLGRIDQSGTDSTGAPGAATINKPIGKSAIAAGASSVVITNSLVSAASHVVISPHARDATCKEIVAVPAAGSFTVSGTANATAALPFSWEVKGML